VDQVEVDYRREFVLRMIPRLDWPVLLEATAALNVTELTECLPESPPGADASDETLMAVHRAMLEYHVVEGQLACADGPVYTVSGGIPNLVGPASSVASRDMDTMNDGNGGAGESS
jgi:multifunctional methyltransferase subunit TRM112